MNSTGAVSAPRPAGTAGPHAWRVRLPAVPEAAARARNWVRAVITVRGIPAADTADTAVLVTSELVTNAIRSAPGSTIAVCLALRPGRLRIEIHDPSHASPVMRNETGPHDENGRGLTLVDMLADEWGWYPTPGGKSVYAILTVGTGGAA